MQTHPDQTPSLSLPAPPQGIDPTQERVWDSRVGFKIPYPASTSYRMLTCITRVNGQKFESNYIPFRICKSLVFFIENVDSKAFVCGCFVLY